jgi:hypothetical protein
VDSPGGSMDFQGLQVEGGHGGAGEVQCEAGFGLLMTVQSRNGL